MLTWLSALGSIRYDEIEILLLDWRAFMFKSYKRLTFLECVCLAFTANKCLSTIQLIDVTRY